LFRNGGACSFCDSCRHKVHNLSEMTRAERKVLVRKYHAGAKVCVAYALDFRGGAILPKEPRRSRFSRFFGALLTLGFAGCSTTQKSGSIIGPSDASACATETESSGSDSGKAIMMGGTPPPLTGWQKFKAKFH